MKRDQAFTLVELMVGLALTLILSVLLMSVVSGSLSLWQRGRNQIDTYSNARQVLTRMVDELKGSIAASGQIQFAENVTSFGNPTPVVGTAENVFFVAPYPNSNAGDLCVIAYRLNPTTHELQRAFVDSQAAWNATTNRYRASGYATYDWRTVASDVLEFELISYSQSDLDTNATPAPTWDSESSSAAMIGNVPRRVVVRLKVIDDKAVSRLDASASNVSAYNLILSQSARVFTADVNLLTPH